MGGSPDSTCSIHVNVIPLHFFVDMGNVAVVLGFLEMLSVRPSSSGPSEPGEDHEGAHRCASSGDLTPVSSPHRVALQQIHQQELEDLNLSVDYLSKESVLGGSSPGLRKIHSTIQVFLCMSNSTFRC
jgi:hypothetical protein